MRLSETYKMESGSLYFIGFLEASTLFTMLAAVKPSTIARILIRTSRAMDRVEGDRSIECLMFRVVKATACLTATSERSIGPFGLEL